MWLSYLHALRNLYAGTKMFQLMTLTFKFNLLFKNLNFGLNFWTKMIEIFIRIFLVIRPACVCYIFINHLWTLAIINCR